MSLLLAVNGMAFSPPKNITRAKVWEECSQMDNASFFVILILLVDLLFLEPNKIFVHFTWCWLIPGDRLNCDLNNQQAFVASKLT